MLIKRVNIVCWVVGRCLVCRLLNRIHHVSGHYVTVELLNHLDRCAHLLGQHIGVDVPLQSLCPIEVP